MTIAAGVLALTFPASVEAVTWSSGVFDVTATLWCIGTVLVSRRYALRVRRLDRIAFFACALMALLCKETGAVAPILVLLDMWALGRAPRHLVVDTGILLGVFGLVGGARIMTASSVVRRPITKYVAQRWVFGTVAALVVPWHTDVIHSLRWLPIVGSVAIVVLTTVFVLTSASSIRVTRALAAAVWLLVGTLPTISFFFVAADLEGSRYLYLPAIGYAVLLVVMVSHEQRQAVRKMGVTVIALWGAIGVAGVHLHQQPWREAAAMRNAVQDAARNNRAMQVCGVVAVTRLPDSVRGAYVFRNGAGVALADAGLTVVPASAASCSFTWNEDRLAFAANGVTP